MIRKTLAVGIIFLFIVTSITPMVIGYTSDEYVSCESEELLDNLAFMCYDEYGSNAKYEYYKEHLLDDYPNDDLETVEAVEPVESPTVASFGGPMDSAWPMYCHDVRHTGRSPYITDALTDIEKVRFYNEWSVEAGPSLASDGTIYYGSGRYLCAINTNFSLKWKIKTSGLMHSGTHPTIDEDGTIYIGNYGRDFYAVNPNGTIKWILDTGGSIASSSAIDDNGTIYFGDYDGDIIQGCNNLGNCNSSIKEIEK